VTRTSLHFLSLISLLLAAACGPKRVETEPSAAVRDTLRPPSAIAYDFMWRQRVIAQWPTGTQEFEAVLQKRDGALTLLGLSPMGLPGFVLTLREDRSISVENRMGRDLPFEPAYILADVQRVFFPWLDGATPAGDAVREGQVGAQHVRERFVGGRLLMREFRHAEARDRPIQIDYGSVPDGKDAAEKVTLDNRWHRYKLVIETFEQDRL
jgi:hypothetical protein